MNETKERNMLSGLVRQWEEILFSESKMINRRIWDICEYVISRILMQATKTNTVYNINIILTQ